MHADVEQIQRFLHGELTPPMEASMRDHVGSCAECGARVAAAEREEADVAALLRHLDHTPPSVNADAVAAAARVSRSGRRGRSRAPGAISSVAAGVPAWGRWAAGLLLALTAAGAAYAIPGSPVRGWVNTIITRVTDPGEPPRLPDRPTEDPRGIVAAPGQNLVIVFAVSQAAGHATIMVGAGEEVDVRALEGRAAFTSDDDVLWIDNRGSTASFEIRIPRAAPRVEIRIGDQRVFLKDASRITTDAPVRGDGAYVLPLSAARPTDRSPSSAPGS